MYDIFADAGQLTVAGCCDGSLQALVFSDAVAAKNGATDAVGHVGSLHPMRELTMTLYAKTHPGLWHFKISASATPSSDPNFDPRPNLPQLRGSRLSAPASDFRGNAGQERYTMLK